MSSLETWIPNLWRSTDQCPGDYLAATLIYHVEKRQREAPTRLISSLDMKQNFHQPDYTSLPHNSIISSPERHYMCTQYTYYKMSYLGGSENMHMIYPELLVSICNAS